MYEQGRSLHSDEAGPRTEEDFSFVFVAGCILLFFKFIFYFSSVVMMMMVVVVVVVVVVFLGNKEAHT